MLTQKDPGNSENYEILGTNRLRIIMGQFFFCGKAL